MIDAHFHIWRLARGDYGWLTPALGTIHRDVRLDDWRAVSRPCGVRGGVLVQAAPTEAETAFLLDQAEQADDVLAVVGWVDLLASDAPARIEALARRPKLRGLRPMLQDIADPDWILQPALAPALQAMVACGLVFDALVKPVHLPRLLRLAARHPDLRIVIDHGAKPAIPGDAAGWAAWTEGMQALARETGAFCKISGLWTEAKPGAPVEVVQRHAGWLLACFGAGRCVWGSDWPVLELAGGYQDWLAAARDGVELEDRGAVFEATARMAYGL
ncbi:amidohydrolase [Pseudorhodoferax sp. Leaf267]|uniref:amidohydrolase family protein n=1 Tax=Pseudorhodoferax sp. Leaf267 TaxID=1736316 RepID=UPI0006F2DD7E|nr:amidohydrolase family protein [Pseudorhodoferax sp. Leaf267]KQP21573.1 amidohydrolase [Pseudorhodoferax sp. Leaf267]